MFICIEDEIINTSHIECVVPHKVVTEHREEWYDQDKTEVKGIEIWMTSGEQQPCFIFEDVSLDDFMRIIG